MNEKSSSGHWIALVTGAFSIFIGLLYLLMITILDFRGPMLPPPPEALGVLVTEVAQSLLVQQPF